MSARPSHQSEAETIPFSFVFLIMGLIILLTVMVLWLLNPAMVPRSLYGVVAPYLPGTASAASLLPTPAAVAALPTMPATDSRQATRSPELAVQSQLIAPSAANEGAAKRDPLAGRPVRIAIPRIGVDAPVVEVDPEPLEMGGQTYYQWQVPNAYEAGWHSNSALLGEVGNTVLNGHHNIHGEIFRHLVELNEGDKIILYDADDSFVYLVTETEILEEQGQPLSVRVKNAQWIEPTEDERITIVTCWPYTDNSHRLVVVAQPATETDS